MLEILQMNVIPVRLRSEIDYLLWKGRVGQIFSFKKLLTDFYKWILFFPVATYRCFAWCPAERVHQMYTETETWLREGNQIPAEEETEWLPLAGEDLRSERRIQEEIWWTSQGAGDCPVVMLQL